MSDDIAAAIAAEEHRQGMPATRGHCDTCIDHFRDEDRAARIAACTHENVIEMLMLCQADSDWLCQDCGTTIEGDA